VSINEAKDAGQHGGVKLDQNQVLLLIGGYCVHLCFLSTVDDDIRGHTVFCF